MQYVALASDYDGTLAWDGAVDEEALRALETFHRSGRKLILVTGRELDDLMSVFPHLDLFDRVVAENGALLYTPSTREKEVLAAPPPAEFLETLKARAVQPLSRGEVIVATWRPHENTVLEVIRELGLELQVIFNKGSVMVLPPGVNKETGLHCALKDLGLSAHNVIGIGDAENDHAFLAACELPVAVANALPSVKKTARLTTQGDHGRGVVELIRMVLDDTLPQEARVTCIGLGRKGDREISIDSYGCNLLVAGASGSGKSTFVAGFLETVMEKNYQVCLIDPEGDYESFPGTIASGDEKHPPVIEQALQTLAKISSNVVVNLIGTSVPDRPGFFVKLLPRLQEMRMRTGRPHWIVIDESHHTLPAGWAPASAELAGELKNMVFITVHPDRVPAPALKAVNVAVAIGPAAHRVLNDFAQASGIGEPAVEPVDLGPGEALVWFRDRNELHRIEYTAPAAERKRHKRKYARGQLGEDRSFYFRGPHEKLNLQAQNLITFLQLASGVDDDTWMYHLRRGDYSTWFREGIKDPELAAEAEWAERDKSLNARDSRERIKQAIEARYTAPA